MIKNKNKLKTLSTGELFEKNILDRKVPHHSWLARDTIYDDLQSSKRWASDADEDWKSNFSQIESRITVVSGW